MQAIPSVDIVPAMENEAIDCGIMLDPIWLSLAGRPGLLPRGDPDAR